MIRRVILLAAVMAVSVSAIAVTKHDEKDAVKGMLDAIKQCSSEDKDCSYLAFSTYRHYFPDSQFVKDTLEIQDSMRAMIEACEAEDKDCGALKAYAFSKIFPDSKDAAEKDKDLDLSTEENKKMVAEIDGCMSDNPLCTHLIITTFCEGDGEKDEQCSRTLKLNDMFESVIEGCEGRMGKFCMKLAEKTACKLFPATCDGKKAKELSKKAKELSEKKEEIDGKFNKKEAHALMMKSIRKCENDDKDCAFLAFRTYRHFFPDSAFVKKATAFEDSMQSAISECEDNDSDCNALKAYAFAKVFPNSAAAKEKEAGLDLSQEQNKKFAAEIEQCLSSNPLCTHIVIAEFCRADGNQAEECKETIASDEKFESLIEVCESAMGDFCKKLTKKTACKVFRETCRE